MTNRDSHPSNALGGTAGACKGTSGGEGETNLEEGERETQNDLVEVMGLDAARHVNSIPRWKEG